MFVSDERKVLLCLSLFLSVPLAEKMSIQPNSAGDGLTPSEEPEAPESISTVNTKEKEE